MFSTHNVKHRKQCYIGNREHLFEQHKTISDKSREKKQEKNIKNTIKAKKLE